MGCTLSVRDTLLELTSVKDAAVDYEKGVAYVLPEGEFDSAKAITAIGDGGKYTAKVQ